LHWFIQRKYLVSGKKKRRLPEKAAATIFPVYGTAKAVPSLPPIGENPF
jgi:hypothetical protein